MGCHGCGSSDACGFGCQKAEYVTDDRRLGEITTAEIDAGGTGRDGFVEEPAAEAAEKGGAPATKQGRPPEKVKVRPDER